jgi:hypothetical protein
MRVQLEIINEFGVFEGEVMNLTKEQYFTIKEMSKSFYETGFEMSTEDNGFIIIPPEIVRKSILKIKIKEDV